MSKELIAPEMEGLVIFLSVKETVQSNIPGKRILVSWRLLLLTGFCDLNLQSMAGQILRADINFNT